MDSAEVGRLAAAHGIVLSELIPIRASLAQASTFWTDRFRGVPPALERRGPERPDESGFAFSGMEILRQSSNRPIWRRWTDSLSSLSPIVARVPVIVWGLTGDRRGQAG